MSDPGAALAEARSAIAERRWPDAYAAPTAANSSVPLTADDLAALADCAWWLGRVEESIGAGERAFQAFVREQRLPSTPTAGRPLGPRSPSGWPSSRSRTASSGRASCWWRPGAVRPDR